MRKKIVVVQIMRYYLEPDSHIRDKVKVVLNLSNYATKEGLFIINNYCCESWSWQTRHYKLVNVPTHLNNLETKIDDLDIGKLKTVPPDLKK